MASEENEQYDEIDLLGIDDQPEHPPVHQNSEGWLVSYADMMTLLFGLFVIFYTMALQQNGDIDQKLKSFSVNTFPSDQKNPIEDKKNMEKDRSYLEQTKKYAEEMYKKLQNSVGKDEYNKIIAQRAELENKMKLEELANIETLKAQQDVAHRSDLKLKNIENELKQAKTAFDEQMKKNIDILAAMTLKDRQLEEKDIQLEEKNSQLKAFLESKPKNDFLMFVSKWETEKHDVDLYVTDPNGREFNFKKRKHSDTSGEFVLDSRYGPGVELWQASKFFSGKYRLRLVLYNQYGNSNDTLVHLTVITNKGHLELPVATLNQKMKEVVFFANIDETGEISIYAK